MLDTVHVGVRMSEACAPPNRAHKETQVSAGSGCLKLSTASVGSGTHRSGIICLRVSKSRKWMIPVRIFRDTSFRDNFSRRCPMHSYFADLE
jgi:hypothetical protein